MIRVLEKKDVAAIVEDCVRFIAGRGGRTMIAMSLGVSKRTVDGWCSPADALKPSAAQLEKLLYLSTVSKLPRNISAWNFSSENLIRIYDDEENELTEFWVNIGKDREEYDDETFDDLANAYYVADISGGYVWSYRSKSDSHFLTASAYERHKIRRIISKNYMTKHQVAEFFRVDEIILTIMLCENAYYRRIARTPYISSDKFHKMEELSNIAADETLI